MFYQPDLIIYLWLVPVFFTITLPLLFIPSKWIFNVLLKLTGNNITAKAPFFPAQPDGEVSFLDKRIHPRVKLDKIPAHISDGMNYCAGYVNDVSKFGICLSKPADKLDRSAERLGVFITGYKKSYLMQVKPKWKRGEGCQQSIGAEIEDIPCNWEDFHENILYMQENRPYIRNSG